MCHWEYTNFNLDREADGSDKGNDLWKIHFWEDTGLFRSGH